MRRISILGATGSIGQSTIDLIARRPDSFAVEALTGGHNIAQLARDAIALNARMAVTAHEDRLSDLREALSGSGIEVAAGTQAIHDAGARPADLVMSAIVGAAGLAPGLAALKNGGTLALANKESLVCAGPLVMAEAARHDATLLPVDSEHSAVFQALQGDSIDSVERVILTASGGAFRDWPIEKLTQATPMQAATHPNWDMGQRITIDSASMFNKALEVIEAKEFFDLKPEQIEVLIHPESLVHALVGHVDGGILAHLGAPDMRHAIGYALNWPERVTLPVERLDLARVASLTFRAPEPGRYPALAIAQRVMQRGGMSGAAMNAAKEVALDAFIDRRIGFMDMATLVSRVLDRLDGDAALIDASFTLDNVMAVDHIARIYAAEGLSNTANAGMN
jgi:1-deoxy-D-xylulose-5-phosphate reductoisomerase